jgi:enoyl-CoA hydratase/carnithine racemase
MGQRRQAQEKEYLMPDYSRYHTLQIDRADQVATVTLNRPESLNAVNEQMHTELETLFAEVTSDDAINAIVLTGAGRAFCAGGDIKGMDSRLREGVRRVPLRGAKRLIQNMLEVEQPIIGAINGDAVGLGATVALFCDMIIADERARFGDTHIKVGLVAGDGGAVVWPLLVGMARAKEFLLTGDLIQATEAERIGLVNRVVPAGQAYTEGLALAKRLAAGPTRAIRWTKLALNKRLKDEVNLVLDASLAVETLSMATDDHREAARAFVEKRPPRFTGN